MPEMFQDDIEYWHNCMSAHARVLHIVDISKITAYMVAMVMLSLHVRSTLKYLAITWCEL